MGPTVVVTAAAVVVVWMLIRTCEVRRRMAHAERMRAYELGMALPSRGGRTARVLAGLAIATLVPVAMLGLGMAVLDRPGPNGFIVVPASVLAFMALVGGIKLADNRPELPTVTARRRPAPPPAVPPAPPLKPVYDMDGYDYATRAS